MGPRVHWSILDVLGRQVEAGSELANSQAGASWTIEVGGLPNSIYFLRVTDGTQSATTRLLVAR